jgi:hypothetical protein
VYASFLFIDIILLFMLMSRNLLVKIPLYGEVSEKPIIGMFDLFSVGTLTCIKSLATMFESVVPPYQNDSQ